MSLGQLNEYSRSGLDPRRYPFKVLLQHPYPLANTDVHLFSMCFTRDVDELVLISFPLVDLPHIAYVHVSINGMEVPIQAARRHDDTFLLKFRPTIAGDYSIVLKDFVEQPVLGCPFILPVFNPSVIQLESFNRLQPLDDCHVICTSRMKCVSWL